MLKPRFEWICKDPTCCVYMGGTAGYDIYRTETKNDHYDAGVAFVASEDDFLTFMSVRQMDTCIDDWVQDGVLTDERPFPTIDDLREAQRFVHTFFPSPVRVAMDRLAKGQDLLGEPLTNNEE